MDEAKEDLEHAMAETGKNFGGRSFLNKVINVIPYFGDGYYEEPAVNYGPAYQPEE